MHKVVYAIEKGVYAGFRRPGCKIQGYILGTEFSIFRSLYFTNRLRDDPEESEIPQLH